MKTILVIDDFASVRFYHEHVLQGTGYRTLVASDGAAALALLGRDAVDLVLLDLLMPTMDGAEFVQRIRADTRLAPLPIVVVTSETGHPRLEKIKTDPACTVLTKPVLPTALLQAVRARLG